PLLPRRRWRARQPTRDRRPLLCGPSCAPGTLRRTSHLTSSPPILTQTASATKACGLSTQNQTTAASVLRRRFRLGRCLPGGSQSHPHKQGKSWLRICKNCSRPTLRTPTKDRTPNCTNSSPRSAVHCLAASCQRPKHLARGLLRLQVPPTAQLGALIR